MKEQTLSRRNFFTKQLQVILGGIGLSALAVFCDKEKKPMDPEPVGATYSIDLNDPAYAELTVVGGAMKLDLPDLDFQVLVIRTGSDTVSALSTICTHAGCPVELPEDGKIWCQCHNSYFSLDGDVLSGPATEPLPQIEARIENSRILFNY